MLRSLFEHSTYFEKKGFSLNIYRFTKILIEGASPVFKLFLVLFDNKEFSVYFPTLFHRTFFIHAVGRLATGLLFQTFHIYCQGYLYMLHLSYHFFFAINNNKNKIKYFYVRHSWSIIFWYDCWKTVPSLLERENFKGFICFYVQSNSVLGSHVYVIYWFKVLKNCLFVRLEFFQHTVSKCHSFLLYQKRSLCCEKENLQADTSLLVLSNSQCVNHRVTMLVKLVCLYRDD